MDNKTHHAIDELNTVHTKMKLKYIENPRVVEDKQRAKKMEQYLRMFKQLAAHKLDESFDNKVDFQRALEIEGMQSVVNDIEKALGSKYLFRLGHWWNGAQEIARKTDADDVFEGQLYMLLQKAGEAALIDSNEKMELGINIVGDVKGNTVKNPALITKQINNITKKIMQSIGDETIAHAIQPSDIIKNPTWRAGKVDVTGYSKTINISSEIKPEWQEFISTFQGTNFSLKNYASNTKIPNEIIHLGNTNYFKAIYGVLGSLGFNANSSNHIYVHTRVSYLFGHTAAQGEGPEHIVHMRFAYELTGAGLYDEQGKKLDEVDFFIYNDPASDNIFVRSVQEMIQNTFQYLDMSRIGDPWTSGIVIAKASFNT